MKYFISFILLIFSHWLFANTTYTFTLHDEIIEKEEPQKSRGQGRMISKTRDALMSVDYIEQRTEYLMLRLKNSAFGEYAEKMMVITPFVTGNLEFNMSNVNFYYNHYQSKSGVEYSLRF